MRCVACDDPLTSGEMGKKSPVTGEDYLLCRPCLKEAGLLSPQEHQEMVIDMVQEHAEASFEEGFTDDFSLSEEDE